MVLFTKTVKPQSQRTCCAGVSTARIVEWLRSGRTLLPDGTVLSWASGDGTAYGYPEAAAWVISFLAARQPACKNTRNRLVEALSSSVSPNGGIGREEGDYAFDTAIVLEALLLHLSAGGELPSPSLPLRLFLFVEQLLRARRAFVPRVQTRHKPQWSAAYGSHLLRLVPVLALFAERESRTLPKESQRARELAVQLIDDLLPLFDGRRFRNAADSDATYLHAHCYAVAGLLALSGNNDEFIGRKRRAACSSIVPRAADWLCYVQRPDGAVPAWYEDSRPVGPGRADSTAQAISIWARLGCKPFCAAIRSAARFLGALQSRTGGIRYDTSSSHENTWATVFAADAIMQLGRQAATCMRGIKQPAG